MVMKYAGSEVLKMAVEIERKGKAFYEDMANLIKDPKVQDIFRFLATEEVRHEVIFTKMLAHVEPGSEIAGFNESELMQFFRSIVGDKVVPSRDSDREMKKEYGDVTAALQKALEMEKNAILYFHEMKNITSEKDHDIIEEIIQEERDHIRKILELMEEYL